MGPNSLMVVCVDPLGQSHFSAPSSKGCSFLPGKVQHLPPPIVQFGKDKAPRVLRTSGEIPLTSWPSHGLHSRSLKNCQHYPFSVLRV